MGSNVTDVSVVIATYNRPADMESALSRLLEQTTRPAEVVVVDDSPDDRTERVVRTHSGMYASAGVHLGYIKPLGPRSLTRARNIGAAYAQGEVVLFIDDDVVLKPEYIRSILEVYAFGSHIKGVTGWRLDVPKVTMKFRATNLLDRFFCLFAYTTDRCELLRSWGMTYPHTLTKLIRCEWFSGCNQSYRRAVLSELSFDEKLMRYAPGGEDLDFSYRVQKKYPGSLYMTPTARFLHTYSPEARTPSKMLVRMESAYAQYLWGKNFGRGMTSRVLFAWSRLGRVVTVFLRKLRRRNPALVSARMLVGAYFECFKHRREIAWGQFAFLESEGEHER